MWTVEAADRRRRVPPPITVLLVLPIALAACGGSGSTSPSTTTAAPTTGSPPPATVAAAKGPSPGCGSPAAPGTVTLTPSVGGRTRTTIVHVPSGYVPSSAVPLVLNMHGSQSTALQQEALTGMDATADSDTFIVAYPQGGIAVAQGYEWNVPGQPLFGGAAVPAGAPDDVSFLGQLTSMLEAKYCVDTGRVYATGFSGGARMASQLACDASTVFAAVAPVSGLRMPAPCPSTRAVPVVSFHGTADPVDPYTGNGQEYWTYGVPEASRRWASHNGCAAAPGTSQAAPGVTLTAYGQCDGDAAVDLYTIAGEGHEWPGGPPLPRSIARVLGPQTTAINANSTMWAFFTAHPLP